MGCGLDSVVVGMRNLVNGKDMRVGLIYKVAIAPAFHYDSKAYYHTKKDRKLLTPCSQQY